MLVSRSMHALEKLRVLFDQIDGLILPGAGALMLILYLAKTLRTGTASLGNQLEFSRGEEPREYWALVILALAGFALTLPWFPDLLIATGLLEFI